MFHSKAFRLSSQPESLPTPLFYTPKPLASWHADVFQSIKRWLTMCCSSRTAYKTSDAAVRILEEGKGQAEEDCEPLIESGTGAAEKREALRVSFPKHAAASFLKTGTSRGLLEANWVM